MSVRTRLLLTAMVTLVVGLGALVLVGNLLLAARVRADASSELQARVETQIAALVVGHDGVRDRKAPNEAVLDKLSWVLDGRRVLERPRGVPARLDAAAIALGRAGRRAELEGSDDIRLRAQPVYVQGSHSPAGAVVVGFSVEPLERLKREVLAGSVVLALLVLACGALALRSALRGALEPVARMTAMAHDWGSHDLERRFALGPARDELTALAATLDELLARIAASRRHEQRFAADAAHELRTPLARLRGRAELALAAPDAAAAEEGRAALSAVVDHARELEQAIEVLLAAARAELDATAGTVDVVALARGVPGVEMRAAERVPPAAGDAEVVRRAIAPLVENARAHARSAVVLDVSAAEGVVRLEVRDDGPGIDPTLGDRAFDAGVRGAGAPRGGAGLGLALARRLARSCGGDVVIGPGPGGCLVLELPAVGAP